MKRLIWKSGWKFRLGVIGLLLLSSVLFLPQAQPSLSWSIVGYTPEIGGYGEAVVGLGDSILILGQHSTETVADVWLFLVKDNKDIVFEEALPFPPVQLKSGTALAWDMKGCVFTLVGGAQADTGTQGRREFLCLDLCSRSWNQILEMTPYEQGAGDALAFVRLENGEAFVYAFFGVEGNKHPGSSAGFARYDISNGSWERLLKPDGTPNLPEGWRCLDDGASLTWDGGRYLYAFHGADCNDRPTKDFARFDLLNNSWDSLTEVPAPVDDGGSLIWDGDRYLYGVTGGVGEEGKGSNPKGFYRFDLQTQQWESLEPLPCPIGDYVGNRLAFVKGCLFAWQGSQKEGRECGGTALMRYCP